MHLDGSIGLVGAVELWSWGSYRGSSSHACGVAVEEGKCLKCVGHEDVEVRRARSSSTVARDAGLSEMRCSVRRQA